MQNKQVAWIISLGLGMLLLMAAAGWTQPKEQAPPTAPGTLTMTGKIVNSTSYGGFIVIRIKPHEEYKILNQNETVLREFAKTGEPVQIEGSLRGAYFLTIDKINGKAYPGPK
ncbi:MAG: hypothetical protein M0P73_03750 [Syntrophobacterales bacterium]|jgi:hypothetical protein|nr:hypothetical protein [Syntrophobacterales bacterium]